MKSTEKEMKIKEDNKTYTVARDSKEYDAMLFDYIEKELMKEID